MSYRHLTAQERYVISHLRSTFSIREIARRLKRHHSTISRELKRAKSRHPDTVYWYDWRKWGSGLTNGYSQAVDFLKKGVYR